jgi:hypothetical protein
MNKLSGHLRAVISGAKRKPRKQLPAIRIQTAYKVPRSAGLPFSFPRRVIKRKSSKARYPKPRMRAIQ